MAQKKEKAPTAGKTIRLFKNSFLERLTHVHPAVPLLLWAPIVAWLMYRSLPRLMGSEIVTILILGLAIWTFVEYVMHRFLFHFDAKSAIGKRLVYLFHGIHHDSPNDLTRLVMPPFPSLIIGAALYPLFYLVFGPLYAEPVFATFICGYLIYDYIHYAVHRFEPKTVVGRYLRNHHMIHHYQSPNTRWGVSSPIWDYVFGTLRQPRRETATSPSPSQSPALNSAE